MIRLYDSNEMARVSSPACAGCGQCCRGMGESVRLDPYDVHMLTGYLGLDFQADGAADGLELLHGEALLLVELPVKGVPLGLAADGVGV